MDGHEARIEVVTNISGGKHNTDADVKNIRNRKYLKKIE
jgi:hypothetical protein